MSVNIPGQNLQQPRSKRRKRKAKSPLSTTCGHTQGSLSTGPLNDTPGAYTQWSDVYTDRQVKRIATPDLCAFHPFSHSFATNCDMNNLTMTSPIGNFQQPFTFGFPQNTPVHGQIFTSPSTVQNTPPPWANQIIEDIKSMKISTSKIEKTVGSIDTKVTEMELKIKGLDSKITEVERSCNYLSTEYDKQRQDLKDARSEIKSLQNK